MESVALLLLVPAVVCLDPLDVVLLARLSINDDLGITTQARTQGQIGVGKLAPCVVHRSAVAVLVAILAGDGVAACAGAWRPGIWPLVWQAVEGMLLALVPTSLVASPVSAQIEVGCAVDDLVYSAVFARRVNVWIAIDILGGGELATRAVEAFLGPGKFLKLAIRAVRALIVVGR
jgi:hypothetical protein